MMLNDIYLREILFDERYMIIGSIIEHMNFYLQPIHGGMNGVQACPEVIRTLVINDNEIQHSQAYSKKPGFKLMQSF